MEQEQIFKLHSEYAPTGDQPQAIADLVEGFKQGNQCQTLQDSSMVSSRSSSRKTL